MLQKVLHFHVLHSNLCLTFKSVRKITDGQLNVCVLHSNLKLELYFSCHLHLLNLAQLWSIILSEHQLLPYNLTCLSYITARSGLNPSSVLTGTIAPSPFTIALSIDVPGTIALSIHVPGTIKFSMYLVQSHPLCTWYNRTLYTCTWYNRIFHVPGTIAPSVYNSTLYLSSVTSSATPQSVTDNPTPLTDWPIGQLLSSNGHLIGKSLQRLLFQGCKIPNHSLHPEWESGRVEKDNQNLESAKKSPKSRSDSSVGSFCQILSNVVTPVTAVGAATRISNWVSSRLNSRMRKQNIRLR